LFRRSVGEIIWINTYRVRKTTISSTFFNRLRLPGYRCISGIVIFTWRVTKITLTVPLNSANKTKYADSPFKLRKYMQYICAMPNNIAMLTRYSWMTIFLSNCKYLLRINYFLNCPVYIFMFAIAGQTAGLNWLTYN